MDILVDTINVALGIKFAALLARPSLVIYSCVKYGLNVAKSLTVIQGISPFQKLGLERLGVPPPTIFSITSSSL